MTRVTTTSTIYCITLVRVHITITVSTTMIACMWHINTLLIFVPKITCINNVYILWIWILRICFTICTAHSISHNMTSICRVLILWLLLSYIKKILCLLLLFVVGLERCLRRPSGLHTYLSTTCTTQQWLDDKLHNCNTHDNRTSIRQEQHKTLLLLVHVDGVQLTKVSDAAWSAKNSKAASTSASCISSIANWYSITLAARSTAYQWQRNPEQTRRPTEQWPKHRTLTFHEDIALFAVNIRVLRVATTLENKILIRGNIPGSKHDSTTSFSKAKTRRHKLEGHGRILNLELLRKNNMATVLVQHRTQ